MALAVEAPAREDLSFRTNDDKRVGARWLKSDAVTPVVITTATLTLRFEPAPPATGPDGLPLPTPPAAVHVIGPSDPTDPAGYIDAGHLADGVVIATIPHTVWPNYVMRTGEWDLVAVGAGSHRCLVRGVFVAEEGIST